MEINLLPPESVVQKYSFSLSTIGLFLFGTLCVVFGSLSYLTYQDNHSKAQLQLALQAKLQQDELTRSKLQSLLPTQGSVTDDLVATQASEVIRVLHDFPSFTQGIVRITSLSVTGLTVSVAGTAVSIPDVAEFARRVQSMSNVAFVGIDSTQTDTNHVNFSLHFRLLEGPGAQ